MAKSAYQELRDFVEECIVWKNAPNDWGTDAHNKTQEFMKLLDNYIQSKINNHTHPELWVFGNDGR